MGRRDPLGWDDPLRFLIREIEVFPTPVIAMIEGSVWGGACETVFACDLMIAAPDATFTAIPVSAERAERLGMINYVIAARELEACTYQFATRIAWNAPLSIAVMKEQLRILAGTHPMSPQGFEQAQGLRRIVYDSHDYKEGIRAFKEKREPIFTGA